MHLPCVVAKALIKMGFYGMLNCLVSMSCTRLYSRVYTVIVFGCFDVY